jgi:hypothetical protein
MADAASRRDFPCATSDFSAQEFPAPSQKAVKRHMLRIDTMFMDLLTRYEFE